MPTEGEVLEALQTTGAVLDGHFILSSGKHAARYIQLCLVFHAHTKEEIYLKKARAMADTLTVLQHPDGFYPTWMRYKPAGEDSQKLGEIFYNEIWPNCTAHVGEVLMKLGEYAKARDIHYQTLPLVRALFIEPNPVPVKEAMNMIGLPAGKLRMPLTELQPKNRDKLRQALQKLGKL